MQRSLAFLFAIFLTTLSVASACTAASSDWIDFTLESARQPDEVRASFRNDDSRRDRGDHSWSNSFAVSELVGLDVNAFRAAGTRPLRFAIVREAGRLDCAGQGGNQLARGNCSFTADPGFMALLDSRGIGRPSRDEQFALVAVNVRRAVIDAIAAARYPTPSIDDLIAATAVGVNAQYIQGLARVGYRPSSIDNLVEFRALNITPEYIGGFARIGYRSMNPDDLVELRALSVTPEYVQGFERIGYRGLSVDKLVQLKALNITPEFVRAVEQRPGELPPIEQLAVLQSLERRR